MIILKRKKILFAIHTLGIGGAEKVLVNLVNNLDSSKYEVTVLTIIDTGKFRFDLNDNIKYISLLRLPFFLRGRNQDSNSESLLKKSSFVVKCIAEIYQFLWRRLPVRLFYNLKIKEIYDVEVAFLEGITTKFISASNQNSRKIAWVHVDLYEEKKSTKIYKNYKEELSSYKKFDAIVSVSKHVEDVFRDKFKELITDYFVRYNPIDSQYIRELSFKNDVDKDSNKFILCTIGRLSPQKGYDRLIPIISNLVKDYRNIELWIIGVGPDELKLKQMVHELNLMEHVKFLGFQKNPYMYLSKADLFVVSSRAEGFSTVASEASILGIPTVTVQVSGMKELFGENNEYGIVVENDVSALEQALSTVLSNPSVLNQYKQRLPKLSRRFDLNTSIKEIEKVLINDDAQINDSSDENLPLISVIIPCYNAEESVCLTIESVIDQTYQNIEILIIDDGSTDNSVKFINNVSDNRISVISIDNQGVSNARNVGLQNAKGELLFFLDSDDLLPKTALADLYHGLKLANTDIIRGTFVMSETDNTIKKREIKIVDEYKIFLTFLNSYSFNSVWGQLIRKELVIKNNVYFNTQLVYGEDALFNMQIYKKAGKIATINKPVYIYLENQSSVTNMIEISKVRRHVNDIIFLYEAFYQAYIECGNQFQYKIHRRALCEVTKKCLSMYKSHSNINRHERLSFLIELYKNSDFVNLRKSTKYSFRLSGYSIYTNMLKLNLSVFNFLANLVYSRFYKILRGANSE